MVSRQNGKKLSTDIQNLKRLCDEIYGGTAYIVDPTSHLGDVNIVSLLTYAFEWV